MIIHNNHFRTNEVFVMTSGDMQAIYIPLPFIPGVEGCGIVKEIGNEVDEVKPGDRVAYVGPLGSYAEYITVPASQLISLRDEISFEQGGAFPLQGMTAHYLIHEFYSIKPGDNVLVHAAAGGVGLFLTSALLEMTVLIISNLTFFHYTTNRVASSVVSARGLLDRLSFRAP
jgi:NADPH:quinone reductase-like Zn-dependent oxidoreductase